MNSSHPNAYHIGGLDEVLDSLKIKSVYAPKVNHTTQAYKDFLLAVKREKLTIKTAKAGVSLPVIGDVKAQFVGPVKEYAKSDLNNCSTVLHIAYQENTLLFTGDAELESEQDIIAKKTLRVDVFKIGHNGAKTSTSATFIKYVKSKYAVISFRKNAYGHPTKEDVTNLKRAKPTMLRTDRSDTIVFEGNGSSTRSRSRNEKAKRDHLPN